MVDPISGTFSQLLNTINRNRSGLQNSLERIASGRKLNRAGTDPAASALSAQLQSDISALTQSVKNVESGTNFVRTADGGLAGIADLVNRGRELAIQSSNGTLNDSQRQTMNQEFGQIQSEIDRLTGSLQFNGRNLLDGSLGQNADPVNFQAGIGSGRITRLVSMWWKAQALSPWRLPMPIFQPPRVLCRRLTVLNALPKP